MTFEEAKESVRGVLNKYQSIIVLEDGTVYADTPIEIVNEIALGLKAYQIKPEIVEIEEVKKSKKIKSDE